MKSYLSTADLVIWIALIACKVVLCLCVFKRHLFRRLPCFSAYILASTFKSILLFAIAFLGTYAAYYYSFFVAGQAIWVLAFLTLFEFGRQVLPSLDLPRKEQGVAWLLAGIGGVVVFSVWWPLQYAENRVEIAAYLIIAVAFIVISTYSRSLGLGWSRLVGGVAFTLGLLYLVEGVMRAATWHYTAAVAKGLPFRQIGEVANIVAAIVWTIVVLSPWGEYEMAEEDLVTFQDIVAGVEANFRRFVAGESR